MKALQGRLKRKEPPPSLHSEEGPAAPAKQTKKAAEMSEEEKKAEHLRRRQQQRESQQERTAGPKPQGEPSVSNCGPGVRPPLSCSLSLLRVCWSTSRRCRSSGMQWCSGSAPKVPTQTGLSASLLRRMLRYATASPPHPLPACGVAYLTYWCVVL